jgi:hypothetical protein
LPTSGAYYDDTGWHIGGCDSGPFLASIKAGATTNAPSGGDTRGGKDSADIAAAAKTFTLSRRSHVTAVSVHGRGAAPQLHLTGPGGVNLKVTKAHPTATDGAAVLTMNPSDNRTYILFRHSPARGVYHLIPLAGSSAIRFVDFSQPLPPASVKAKLRAVGCQQHLTWKLRRLPGQKVVFVDRGAASQRTLKSTNAATGSLAFSPQTATSGAHKIVAMVMQQGTLRREIVVARYTSPTGTGRVTGLRARRKGNKTTVSWKPVCTALDYAITVKAGKTTKTTSTKKTSTVITGKGKRSVSVLAVNFAGQTGKRSTITIH